MSAPRVLPAFTRLERRLQRHFGGDLRIWWPASAGLSTYTVAIPLRQTEDSGASEGMAGLLSIDAGTVTLHALKADFPFPPDERQIFLLGTAAGTAKKHEITSVSDQETFGHYTIRARRH